MNLKHTINDSGNRLNISLLFIVLVIAIESLLIAYWYLILEPRFRVEANGNAQVLAESESRIISQSLFSNDGYIRLDTVDDVIDGTLLLNDPLLNEPFFIGISIEIDPDVYNEQLPKDEPQIVTKELIHSRGNINCGHCFSIELGLYSHVSNELIGLAHFQVNDAIFQKFKSDIKNKLFAEAVLVLIIALLVWYATMRLVSQLHIQINVRKKAEADLLKAKEKAEMANETKSQFLANMSHEIRTPLNAVIGMGYLVLKGELSEKQRNYLKKMDSSAHLLLALINDILDFSKCESGKLELEKIKFTIDEVLDNINKVIISKAEEKEIDLVFSISKQVPEILLGDPLRLSQILLNLCNNALKFTHQGTIVIAIEVVETRSKQITLQFNVTDTGIGMDEVQQKKLFQSFSQVDSSTTRKYGGSGLGLAISKQLTELMQGKIWVKSQKDEGTTFSFTAIFGLDEQLKISRKLPIELKNRPVLVIDDNLISLQVFAEMLQDFSFDVHTATNAEDGMKILDEMNQSDHPIQLILMDWRLPGINGIEAARLIKNRSDLKVMPCIILITAYTNDEIIESARDYLDAYHPKPLTPSHLYDSIITLFSEHEHNAQHPIHHQNKDNETSVEQLLWPDVNLLLVEDNVINQEVATAILQDTRMSIDIANNGFEAVEKVKSNQYDLILMDVQMPGMDGLEATTIIRQNKANAELPIIAMTAHALQKHREQFIATGMNDFIAKPIVIDHFFSTLKKWLPQADTDAIAKNKVANDNLNILSNPALNKDLPGIDMQEVIIRFKGNTRLYTRLLNKFITSKTELIEELHEHIQDNNWQQAGTFIHALKGTSGNLCMDEIYSISIELEKSFENQSTQISLELFQRLSEAFIKIKQSVSTLEQLIEANNTENNDNNGTNIELARLQVKELEELILENNLRAKIVVKELNATLNSSIFKTELKKLNNELSSLDFDNALNSLKNISNLLNS
ncbi:MAG: response regulator [Gammaproteobacteria bacterium]|nr:response regulator [Gammaproteobacteria bacterium]